MGGLVSRLRRDGGPAAREREFERSPHFQTTLGYYWGQFDPVSFGSPVWAEEQEAAWGGTVSQPVLYLHGTNDGCHGLDEERVKEVPTHIGEGSESELIEGVGHFMLVERPEEINARILGFLGA
jgi:pimeloyl-ACP methyl ester carboxylesterase